MDHIRCYFTNLFSEAQDVGPEVLPHGNYPTLNENEWQEINRPFQPKEIKQALFEMDAYKPPGLDSFTAGFFKNHGRSWVNVLLSLQWISSQEVIYP